MLYKQNNIVGVDLCWKKAILYEWLYAEKTILWELPFAEKTK